MRIINNMKKFLIAVITAVITMMLSFIVTSQLPTKAKANTQASTYGMVRVAYNSSNDRYVEVYALNYNNKKFLVTKSWSGHWYGGTSSSITIAE